jgi:hypothetical protein
MCLAGYPKKHTPRLYPRHKQDQLVPLLSWVSRSPSKLGLLPPVLEARPQYGAKTSTYPRLQSVGPERAGAHDKRVTSLPSPHPLVYARDKKICDLTRVQCNERSLIDTGGTNATRAPLCCPTRSKSIQPIPPGLQLSIYIYIPWDGNMIIVTIRYSYLSRATGNHSTSTGIL